MKKQEEIKGRFNISDIKKTASKGGHVKKKKKIVNKLSSDIIVMRFRIDDITERIFQELRNKYASQNHIFGMDESEFFSLMTAKIKDDFSKNKMIKEANKEFIDFITRTGKRKSTERTPNEGHTVNLMIKTTEQTNHDYINLMYSYYSKYNNSTLYETYLSRTYFFYDFIQIIKNKMNYKS